MEDETSSSALGFVLLPIHSAVQQQLHQFKSHQVSFKRSRQPGNGHAWKTWLSLQSPASGAAADDDNNATQPDGELQLQDAAAVELLQALGRVAHDHKLTVTAELLLPPEQPSAAADAAAATEAAEPDGRSGTHSCAQAPTCTEQNSSSSQLPCPFVKLTLGLPESMIQHSCWKRSPAAAILFKQLFQCDNPLGDAVQAVMLPRLAPQQQQQQQQVAQQTEQSTPGSARYTLLSCFRELPSVNTAPPPMAISIQQQQQQPQLQGVPAAELSAAAEAAQAAADRSSSPGRNSRAQQQRLTSLADIPPEVMNQLLSLLSARDLAALALTCKGLRAASWEAVPALKLTLYPHQRNALSWMLHREVHGGQAMPHPFIRPYVTAGGQYGGVPLYLNQVTGEASLDPPDPLLDIRGGFFCDEPGLGKTVTALALILKTQGTVPAPPQGAAATWLTAPDGRRLGFYTPPDPAAADTADMELDPAGHGHGLMRRHSSSSSLRRSGSSCLSLMTAANGRRGSSRQSSAWQLAPSLRGGSSTRRARASSASAAAGGAAAAGGGGDAQNDAAMQLRCNSLTPASSSADGITLEGAGSAGAAADGQQAAATGSVDGQLQANTDSQAAVQQPSLTGPWRRRQQQQDQQQQHERPRRVTRQSVNGGSSVSPAAGAAADGADQSLSVEQSAPKRLKLNDGTAAAQQPADQQGLGEAVQQQNDQQQQLQQQDKQGDAGVDADGGVAGQVIPEHLQRGWVMCDHCSKWRSLDPGYQLPDSDPDLPWFCSMHPDPHLASCLAPEEPHDGNTKATADPSIANLSYSACAGFLSADAAAAAAAADEPDADNLAHFSAVINAAAMGSGANADLRILCWLAKQKPDALLAGVTVPREMREAATDYGRLFITMSLQPASAAAAAAAAGAAAARTAKPPKTPPKGQKQPGTSSKGSTKKKKQRKRRRGSSSDEDSDSDYMAELEEGRSHGRSHSSRSQQGAKSTSPTPAPAQQQTKNSGSGGTNTKPRRMSAAATAATAHTWCQPHSLSGLVFDVRALQKALARGAASSPRMFLSSATLVIVPVTLIPHWQVQIRQHLLPRRLKVLVLGSATAVAGGQEAAAGGGSSRSSKVLKASSTAAGGGGAAESVCPPAHELAWGYDVVITTFQRLSSDWSMRSDPRLAERLVLLKVHWLRIIVDEGHSLGVSLGITNKLAMAVQLTAQRRWVMTGTPTPSTSSGSGAAYLQPLLAFLHQEPFGSSKNAWDGAVARPLEAAAEAASSDGTTGGVVLAEWGRQQLLQLLNRVMIRSCKSDLALLPPCYKKVTLLDFAPAHAKSYNALVEVIRRNLLLADWCDDAHVESLLNAKQSRWAKEMLFNARLACCVAGGINLVPKEEDVLESLQLLSGRLGHPQPNKEQHVVLVNSSSARDDEQQLQAASGPQAPPDSTAEVAGAADGEAGAHAAAAAAAVAAAAAGGRVSGEAGSPTSPSTAHAANSGDQPGAGPAGADADAGALEPAGLVLRRRWYYTGPNHPLHTIEEALREGCDCQVCGTWSPLPLVTPCGHLQCTDCSALSRTHCRVCSTAYRMQATNDPERYKTNPQPKWEVPLELIEWQPVYHQAGATGVSGGEWGANWRITRSTKVLLLVQRLVEIGVYSTNSSSRAAAAASHQGTTHQPFGSTQPHAQGLQQQQQQQHGKPPQQLQLHAGAASAVKVIVFSQFWTHVQLVAAELSARGVRHVVLKRDMAARDKQAAVMAFRATPHSCCLVMDESGALGLDLSFVRYIFLMEPLADASLEQQVVSRAHRMGAVAPVHVEVLAMKHTAEEHMVALRHQAATGKLSASAADAAASSAAAAVAGAAAAADPTPLPAEQQQQQQQPEEEELGGATATAKAVDISNITDFVALGAGDNQLNNRALRNLLLLHLRKVNVAELPELPDYEGPATLPDAVVPAAAETVAAAAAADAHHAMWSDVALQQPRLRQQQQQQEKVAGATPPGPTGQAISSNPPPRRVMFAADVEGGTADAADASPDQHAAGAKPRKSLRFADGT